MAAPLSDSQKASTRRTALICSGVALGMVGLSFAAVPLYDMFCKVTGFGGTPMVGTAGASVILDRTMSVRFDANVSPKLGWRFEPETPEVTLRVGETKTVFYKITNRSDKPTTGIASYNVTPEKSAAFFVKIQCFCFTEHHAPAGRDAGGTGGVLYRSGDRAESRDERHQVHHLVLYLFSDKAGRRCVGGP